MGRCQKITLAIITETVELKKIWNTFQNNK